MGIEKGQDLREERLDGQGVGIGGLGTQIPLSWGQVYDYREMRGFVGFGVHMQACGSRIQTAVYFSFSHCLQVTQVQTRFGVDI